MSDFKFDPDKHCYECLIVQDYEGTPKSLESLIGELQEILKKVKEESIDPTRQYVSFYDDGYMDIRYTRNLTEREIELAKRRREEALEIRRKQFLQLKKEFEPNDDETKT
jgi:uridine kinase